LRGDVLLAGRGSECPQPILLARDPAEFLQRASRDAATRDPSTRSYRLKRPTAFSSSSTST
jgi:hypothetical protein